ncbi:MAG: tetratricopeptide repeat protein [Deltaproteobacteria bacterium]|nr:tetratricopeptide repeat protein [Deltaproteobacteria bacterium]
MKGCIELKAYLLGALDDAGRAGFEAHAAGCERCAASLRSSRRANAAMGEWREIARSPVPIEDRAESLMRAARRTTGGKTIGRPAIRIALVTVPVAAAIIVGMCFVLARPEALPPAVDRPIAARDDGAPVEILFNDNGSLTNGGENGMQVFSVPGPGRLLVAIGHDRFDLGAGSKAAILENRKGAVALRLEKGRVTVAARRRAIGETLVVRAGAWSVTVVGTRFEVAFDGGDVSVAVDEGTVSMTRAGGPERLVGAGVRLVAGPDGKVREVGIVVPAPVLPEKTIRESADTAKPAPDLETMRRWILDGEHHKAEAALEDRVRRDPNNADAWMLLAACRQKTGDKTGAAEAYEKVIARGDAAQANRGRFLAAKLYQEGLAAPDRAEKMLEEYVAHAPRPLEAEAMVRLAQTELALGKEAQARKTAEDVATRFPGSAQALAARGLLKDRSPATKEKE